jgi:hypothetical protein
MARTVQRRAQNRGRQARKDPLTDGFKLSGMATTTTRTGAELAARSRGEEAGFALVCAYQSPRNCTAP